MRAVRPARVASPIVAAFLSVIVPGAGQLYAGRVIAAFLWFFAVGMGYVLILPGLVLHLFCIASAVSAAHAHNGDGGPHLLAPGRS
jgi:TM2 domain-containing membrane protein YozV